MEYIDSREMENSMLEHFGENFFEEAVRIINTRTYAETDEPLIHEAMCIIIAIYLRKIKDGEINKDRMIH